MVALPENEVTQADLEAWYKMKAKLSKLKGEEMQLRLKIYRGKFISHDADGNEVFPKEGTSQVPIDLGFVLKAQRVIDRKVDVATLKAMEEEFTKAGIRVADLVEYKPELKTKEYRTLTAEQLALFDQALIIKDGSPQLEIMKPKQAAKRG